MIKKLTVKNFQSIEEAEVNLTNGINTFIGESNYGKTALASRAIKILLYNSVFPERMITHGKKDCTISAEILDPVTNQIVTITRYKNATTSYFTLNGLKLEKSGSTTGIALLKEHYNIEFSNINIQEQHNPHYFITMSPTEAGIELMSFFNLTEQNDIKDKIAKLQRDNKVILQDTIRKIDDLSLKIYAAQDARANIESYIKMLEITNKDIEVKNILKNELESYSVYRNKVNSMSKTIDVLKSKSENFINVINKIETDTVFLNELINLQNNSKYVHINKDYIDSCAATVINCMKEFEKTNSIVTTLTSYGNTLSDFYRLNNEHNLLKQQTHGMVCPTCNQVIH